MKAKNISGRLARFLAVLMAMVLIVSCMAIPVALAEESAESSTNVKFLVCFPGVEESLYKATRSELRAVVGSDFFDNFSRYIAFDSGIREENHQVIYVIVEGGAEELYTLNLRPNTLFFLDAGDNIFGAESAERSVVYWAVSIARMLEDNCDVYLYTSNSETESAEITKRAVDMIKSDLIVDNQYNIVLEEIDENSYVVRGSAESETPSGTLHIISLDISPEEAWEQVYSDLQNYLLIATGQAPEVSEDDITESSTNE